MEIYRLSETVPDNARGAVTAIGNFDGLHRGHMTLLEVTRKRALDLGRPFAVLTFEPHPRRLFRPDDAPFRLTPLALKLDRLKTAKADIVFILDFDWPTAQLSADDFTAKILQQKLGLTDIVVGADFHFGQNRTGSIGSLERAGLHVTAVGLVKDAGHAVYSATRIRGLLQAGQIAEANALLGWNWEIRGEVVHGDKRGRELGYPTANMRLDDTLHPAYGIYASLVKIEGKAEWRQAASNIGIRPMFEAKIALIESFLLDYSGDLYGKVLRVRPVARLRGEAKFDSLEDLKIQMAKDCAQAGSLLPSGEDLDEGR